jgi:hypothetical protein
VDPLAPDEPDEFDENDDLVPRIIDSKIEDAIRECHGMVYVAAERIGCSPNTIKAHIKKNARLRAVLEEQDGLVNDLAEMKLFEAICNGDPWAIQFRLRTRARDRGYAEHVEQNVNLHLPIPPEMQIQLDEIRALPPPLNDGQPSVDGDLRR